ncbi:phosphatidylinositol 3,4,5-trisphosphate-dependent Rac exchanger 1 protein-like [Sycon ciliatum]|uniref:phosphatidylinositol 3,4,5-trisphosphate-dependent Rac exchanger 1 protein-like n=1 Tax=Sycon ciliatum TaxID=27933 RepID=UPI0020AB5EE5|eukprot:scpid9950/ scgid21959/ Phosphatidylinositol 3,4,5-trisphosphate-dependent Rac exchanger 2 protein; DEP domain-containing protein 2
MSDAASKEREKTSRLRICTVKEIVDTERAYLQTLEFVSTGIQDQMRSSQAEHPEFTDEMIESIVLNTGNLRKLHTTMVAAFDKIVQDGITADLKVASVFLTCKNELRMEYSTYGSNYERAQTIVSDVMKREPFKGFFQTQLMTLGKAATVANVQGLFLSPVQRVCKYPLLMRELCKHTGPDHPDYEDCNHACEVMKEVCSVINEARRRMEKLEEIMDWQAGIEGWEGPNLVDTCNELLRCGVLLKITASKAQERHFFLFDHLLVQCKKLDGKRRKSRTTSTVKPPVEITPMSNLSLSATAANVYQFKGSILLDMLEIDEMVERPGFVNNNVHYQYGWRIQDKEKKKAFMCMTQTIEERKEWVESILFEREKVRAFKLKSLQDSYVLIAARGDRVYKAMRKSGTIRDHKNVVGSKNGEAKCFSGMEFVQFMLESKECESEEEAVELGCALVSNGIIHHVSDKSHFKNENFLYRFRFDDGTFEARVESSAFSRKALQYYVRLHMLTTPIVRDIKHKLGSGIKHTFTGKELVDFLVAHNDFSSREDAQACCDELLGEGLLSHVDGKSQFRDREDMHYRFCADELKEKTELAAPGASQVLEVQSAATTRAINIRPKTDTLGFSINSSRPNVVSSVVATGIAATQGLTVGANIHTVNGVSVVGIDVESIVGLLRNRSTWLSLTYMSPSTEMKRMQVASGEKYGYSMGGSQPVSITHVVPDSAASRVGLFPGLAIARVDDHDTLQAGLPVAMKILFGKSLEDDDDHTVVLRTQSTAAVPSIVVDDNRNPDSDAKKILSWVAEEDKKFDITVALPDIIHNVLYNYSTPNGSTVQVQERSIESLFTYSMPAKLYALWAAEDAALSEDVRRLSDTLPENNPFSSYLLNYNRRLNRHVGTYRQCEASFRQTHFPSFKGNKDSARISYAGCPMNCHVYELVVETNTISGESLHSTHHSVLCAAPSTVHQMGNCGLQSQMTTLDSILGVRAMLTNCQRLCARVCQAADVIHRASGDDYHARTSLSSNPSYGPSPFINLSSSCVSLASVVSGVSEDEGGDDTEDFATINLNSPMTPQSRAMAFCSQVTKYLGSCVNKAVVNAFLVTDGLLISAGAGDKERRTSISQYLEPNISAAHKALTSSISSANVMVKENERLAALIQANEAPFDKCVWELFENLNTLHSEIFNRLMCTIAQDDDLQLIQRRDAVFSQVLSSFMSGFLAKLESALGGELNPLPEHHSDTELMSNRWLLQLADCGIVADYEVIVDPTVDAEMSMLEDAVPAVSQLENVTIYIRRWTKKMAENDESWDKAIVEITGSRYKLDVTIFIDDCRYEKLPLSLQTGSVRITPCVFSANLCPLPKEAMASSEGRRTFQVSCNITSVDKLREYYKIFRSCVLDKSRLPENPEEKMVEIDRLLKPLHTLGETISALSKTVEYGKGDNIYNSAAVLSLASEVTHRCGGVRVSSSLNGNCRNVCATTLDAAMLLCRSHQLPLANLRKACDLLRSEGVLMQTMEKNSLTKYPFTREPLPVCSPPANLVLKKEQDLSSQPTGFKKRTNKSIFRKR